MRRTRAIATLLSLTMLVSISLGGAGAAIGAGVRPTGPSVRPQADARPPVPRAPRSNGMAARRAPVPSSASAASARSVHPLAVDDNIPGVALPASPVTGSVDATIDMDDVYAVALTAGQRILVELNGDVGTGIELFLFAPDATDVATDFAVGWSLGEGYPERMAYTVPAGADGTYYLDVYAFSGAGDYSFTWQIGAADPDDNIPGIALPASPVTGTADPATDWDDVYSIALFAGQSIDITLTGGAGTDFDLYVFPPGTMDVENDPPEAASAATTYPETISYNVPLNGTYYIDVFAATGDPGQYTLEWSVRAGTPTDDNIPGLALPPSPFGGALDDATDWDDVFYVDLAEGEEFVVSVTDAGFDTGTHPYLFLYPPGTFDVETDPQIAWSKRSTSPQSFTFVVPPGGAGRYYLDLWAWFIEGQGVGDGTYTVTWSIDSNEVVRLFGDSRYQTNQAVSRSTFTSATTAILATGANFADALSASGLAGAFDAPIILTKPTELTEDAATELWRLGVTDVIIVGGPPAISTSVETSLTLDGYNVERVAGASRYDTAAKIAQKLYDVTGSTPEAFVVRGDNYPDALAAAPFAYSQRMPVLLTKTASLEPVTQSYLTSAGVTDVYIAGSPLAVSDTVKNQIDALPSMDVTRVAGGSRYATARALADFGVAQGWGTYGFVGIATGANFPDALSGGAACGSRGGVLLLTEPTVLSAPCSGAISDNAGTIQRIAIFGGPSAVSEGVKTSIAALLGP